MMDVRQIMQGTTTWYCPKCESQSPFTLYNEKVIPQKNIAIKPILPTCIACGAEVLLPDSPARIRDTQMIILTGTCASGKSTTAEILVSRHGFSGIDGNCVRDVVKYKLGTTQVAFNGTEMLREIEHEIDILLSLQQDIVLSHVIIPDDLPKYRAMLRGRGLNYRIFVLQPQYSAVLSRSKARTCFKTLTPEVWIKHFYDAVSVFTPQEDVVLFDNSEYSVEESAEKILCMYQCQ